MPIVVKMEAAVWFSLCNFSYAAWAFWEEEGMGEMQKVGVNSAHILHFESRFHFI